MKLSVLAEELAVCQLASDAVLPEWAAAGALSSVTRTREEFSVVCVAKGVPPDVRQQSGWRALQVEGPLDFSLVGILASLAGTLAQAGVSIFVISTFNTDYILVRDVEGAVRAFRAAGHTVIE